ncbi:MAG: rRNA pseudouridine synthase [Saprospiraceae bacterium]|nr:rRNA pseudouridine synthase [Bacteroidia bacterium]NNF22551.1 rRNA pseudouridine synthase [Saprospiraceae bacterium]
MKYRLNKFIAHAGVCSRRKAAELVKSGYIKVNGEVETNPAIEVTRNDKVEYLGKAIKPIENKVYLLLNKPKNVITTMDDERGRKTVWDIVKSKVSVKIFPVGRLDRNTTGLLLLTNDGDLTQKLSHPRTKVKKIYQVVLDKPVTEKHMESIKEGLVLEDGKADVDEISYILDKPANYVGIELHSGKNRIIRRIFEHLGYEVTSLDRVYFAGLTKKDLPRGWSRFLRQREVIMLKHFTK